MSLGHLLAQLPPAVAEPFDLRRFLALAEGMSCSPVVVAVRQGGELAGIVFGMQRRVLGRPIGVVTLGQHCGDSFIVANQAHQSIVLSAALSCLASHRHIHTVRTWTRQCDVLAKAFEQVPGMILTREPPEDRELLRLGTSFETFLKQLGRRTRRNIRYYRRRAIQNGWQCMENLSAEEIETAVNQLAAHQRTSCFTYSRIKRLVKAVLLMPKPIVAGMRTEDGLWLSIVAGWRRGSHGYFVLQLNRGDREYDTASLSLVSRSHVLEWMMSRGVDRVWFAGGCVGPLRKYCERPQHEAVTLSKPGWRARIFSAEERFRRAGRVKLGSILGVMGAGCHALMDRVGLRGRSLGFAGHQEKE